MGRFHRIPEVLYMSGVCEVVNNPIILHDCFVKVWVTDGAEAELRLTLDGSWASAKLLCLPLFEKPMNRLRKSPGSGR